MKTNLLQDNHVIFWLTVGLKNCNLELQNATLRLRLLSQWNGKQYMARHHQIFQIHDYNFFYKPFSIHM